VNGDEEVPQWVMPAIRALCKTFKKPEAAPHVFAGVSSVLKGHRTNADELELQHTPSRKRKRPSGPVGAPITNVSIGEEHITALIAVITFYTLSELEQAPDKEGYLSQRKLAMETLAKFEPRRQRDKKYMVADIELFMQEAQNGWLDMDWYRNILDDRRANGSMGEDETQSSEDELADGVDRAGMSKATRESEVPIRRGFGTMFSDTVDWLSEDRKSDYIQWRKKILAEIAEIEKRHG
jgi:origin recognition complex subunit 6